MEEENLAIPPLILQRIKELEDELDKIKKELLIVRKENTKIKEKTVKSAINAVNLLHKEIVSKIKEIKPRMEEYERKIAELEERLNAVVWDSSNIVQNIDELRADLIEFNVKEFIEKIDILTSRLNDIERRVTNIADSQVHTMAKISGIDKNLDKRLKDLLDEYVPLKLLENSIIKLERRINRLEHKIDSLEEIKYIEKELEKKIDSIEIGRKLTRLKEERKQIEERIKLLTRCGQDEDF